MLFLETGSPAKSLSTKTDLVNMFLSSKSAALGFPTRYRAVSMGESGIHEARSSSGPNVSLFRPDLICLGPKYESLMQADLYRVASSFFRIGLRLPSNTCLSCGFSRGVLTALVFVVSR